MMRRRRRKRRPGISLRSQMRKMYRRK